MKKILFIISIFAVTQFSLAQKKTTKQIPTPAPTPVTSTIKSTTSKTTSSKSDGEGFNQGDWFISGQFGYTSKKNAAGGSNSELAIAPSIGYFMKENLALRGTLGIINSSSGGATSSNTFVIGAAVRYYMTPTSKFSLFGQGGIEFKTNDEGTALVLGVKPGLNYFVAKNFSLEATFGNFGIANTSPKVGDGSTDFEFGIDMSSIGLGLNYRF